ncbi:MAG: hypothetical protein O7C56_04110 [Rickettsia endosymbiont of Ixodes persulcatus]|nr:hypothetical protein [Rickettsia endosymbiont of Ixodes persulcatus]
MGELSKFETSSCLFLSLLCFDVSSLPHTHTHTHTHRESVFEPKSVLQFLF